MLRQFDKPKKNQPSIAARSLRFFTVKGCQMVGMPGVGSRLSTLPIKLLSLTSPSRHLDSNQKGGCVREERTLRRSQTGQAQFGLSCKAGTGDLGVLPTLETSSMNYVTYLSPFLGSPDDLEAKSIGLSTETDEKFSKEGSTACTGASSW